MLLDCFKLPGKSVFSAHKHARNLALKWLNLKLQKTIKHLWSAVACRIRNRESPGSNPFVTVLKFRHFRSLHDASVHSAV